MKTFSRSKRWTVLLIGVFVALSFLVLAAANNTPEIGRYRMSLAIRNNFTDIYILDTATGVVKYVGKDEGKPFAAISGK